MSMMPTRKISYKDGRTKQSFKDSTDINKILKKAQKTGAISHLAKYEGVYGDFASFDFTEAQLQIAKATTIFEELPSELRNEFQNDPGKFFEFANAPENIGKLSSLLPQIAEPGSYFPNVRPTAELPPDEPAAEAPAAEIAGAGVPAETPAESSSGAAEVKD